MCAIVGLISLNGNIQTEKQKTLTKLQESLYHRGPDQNGTFFSDRVLMASQRLILLDPSNAGQMPMYSSDKDLVIIFNGEISNYIELKKEYNLTRKYNFKSKTDTEVLLYLYLELGDDFVKKLNGMFSFILFDLKQNKVLVARDNFGITPLFYYQEGADWWFASEIKALLEIPSIKKKIDPQAIYDSMTLAYIPGSATGIIGIHEVLAGERLIFDLNNQSMMKEKYFTYKIHAKPTDESKAIKETREALLESLRRHLRADVPIGAMCSGGIDTSSLIGMAKHLGLSQDLHTFSIRILDQAYDESKYQQIIADYAGTKHHTIDVGLKEVIEHFELHLAFMDEPYGHGAALPTFLLAKEAKKYVKALLSGEGGDELFNAYETHGANWWKERYQNIPLSLRKLINGCVQKLPVTYSKLSFDFKLKRFCEGANLPTYQSHLFWRHVLHDKFKDRLFKGSYLSTYRLSEALFKSLDTDDYAKLSHWDIDNFFFGDLMVKNDRMCQAHSVEGRFPYMDRIVTDVVFSMPSTLKIKNGQRRYLQKEAMKPFLPSAIYERSGFGLELPYNKWFLGDLSCLYEKYFNQEYFSHFDFLNWQEFHHLFMLHQKKKMDLGRFLWSMLILCAWYDLHILTNKAVALRSSLKTA